MFILRKLERGFWTGAKIVIKLALLLPIPIAMLLINFTVDRDGLFHGERFERSIALSLLSGENLIDYDTMDERAITELYVQNLEEPLDTVALGSSRILQMNHDTAGTDSFYNCGMSGADFRDILGTFYLFDRADKLPKNLIIGLDPWLLSGEADAWSERSDTGWYEEFLTLKLGIDAGYTPPDNSSNYYAMLSPAYFQDNLQYYFVDSKDEVQPKTVSGDVARQSGNVKMSDGSVLYSYDFRQEDVGEVDARAHAEAGTFLRMEGYTAPDETLCDIFDRFIQYAQGRGVNIIFVLAPYHPIVYTYAAEQPERYPGFFLTEPWFQDYAKEHGIPVYGSYNPFVVGAYEKDFYDGLHVRNEAFQLFFPGMPQVLKDETTARPGSPWVWSKQKVTSDTAKAWVIKRYSIEAPHVLLLGDDLAIDNQQCYAFLRYDSDAPNATLLARYAVSQETGAIYRYDTDIRAWVPFLMFT